jgi:hypothetical protein
VTEGPAAPPPNLLDLNPLVFSLNPLARGLIITSTYKPLDQRCIQAVRAHVIQEKAIFHHLFHVINLPWKLTANELTEEGI